MHTDRFRKINEYAECPLEISRCKNFESKTHGQGTSHKFLQTATTISLTVLDFGFEPENYDLGLRGQYTLWDNGQREGSFAQAKESLTATVSRNERTKQDLILDITVAYYDVLKRQELVKVSEQVLARSQENTQRTRDFVEAGTLIPADVATAELREANDELSLLNNRNSLQIAQATLPRLLGLDPGVLLTVSVDESYQLYQDRGTI